MKRGIVRLFILVLLVIGSGIVINLVGMTSQQMYAELGATTAAKYVDLPHYITDSKFYYFGFGQGKSVYAKLEIPNEYLGQFLSKTCFKDVTALSKVNNPFIVQSSNGEGVPLWWTPREDPDAVGGSCSQNGIGFDISIVSGKEQASVYIYLGVH